MNHPIEWARFFDERAGRYRYKHKDLCVVRDTLMDIDEPLKKGVVRDTLTAIGKTLKKVWQRWLKGG